jgi:translation initiation factor IF-2
MKRTFMLLALCATVAVPAVAFAQAGPGPGPGMPAPPSPEQRAMMEKLRADAKTSAYNALTPAHRDRVTAIVADVAAGKQSRADAAKAIDDLLTPDEQKAVRDAATASFQARRAAMGAAGPPPGPPNATAPGPNAAQPGPNGPPPGAAGPGGPRFAPSAGRFLLMVSLTRGQLRNLEPRARSTSAP